MYCKVCGYELGDPENEDLHDPKGLSDVAKDIAGGPIENEGAHLIVRDGEKGWRYFCSETGKTTSIVPEPPESGDEEGEGGSPKGERKRSPEGRSQDVYDLPEDKSAIDILREVVTRPFLGLNEEQISEIQDWANDYNGQLPPDILGDILSNMKGIQDQAARLARQKYEVKLNKWVRQQAQGDRGPPIGISSQPTGGGQIGRQGSGAATAPQRTRSGGSGEPGEPSQSREDTSVGGFNGDMSGDIRKTRRIRRMSRRNDAMDIAAQEVAQQAAQEFTGEFLTELGRYIGLPAKILESKAKKDPDWFLEKLEQWDIDLDAFLEPSEARKEELRQRSQPPEADRKVDEALERMDKRDRMDTEKEPVQEQQEQQEQDDELFDDFGDEKEDRPPDDEGIFDDDLDREEIPQRGEN